MSHTGYHTHQPIAQVLQWGDNKLKGTFTGQPATEIRQSLIERQAAGHLNIVIGNCRHIKTDGSCAGHIMPIEPDRNADGYYAHPGMPDFADDADAMANWFYEQDLQITSAALYDEPEESEPFQEYFENGNGVAKWQPPQPAGDGWFILAITDTDDGAVCWWARHQHAHNVITIHKGQQL